MQPTKLIAVSGQGYRLLIIDQDSALLQLVEQAFLETGITVQTAANSRQALHQLYAYHPDLVLLDVMLPDHDGWQTLAYIQEATHTPVILMTEADNVDQAIRALDQGAIDYIAKPFLLNILVARVKAMFRTFIRRSAVPSETYADTYLRLDMQTQRLSIQGLLIPLTTAERKLLFYLVAQANQICSYTQLLEHVWGWEYRESTQYIHVYISRLRRKIEPDPKRPRYLRTIHGIGYQFQK